MNAEQIAKMKELAKNASPGPWFTQTHCADNGEHSHIGLESQEGAELIGEEVMPCDADMRFIAAANPAAVLELIALAERTTSPVSELTNEQIIAIADRTKTAESRDGDYILPISFARAILAAAAPHAQAPAEQQESIENSNDFCQHLAYYLTVDEDDTGSADKAHRNLIAFIDDHTAAAVAKAREEGRQAGFQQALTQSKPLVDKLRAAIAASQPHDSDAAKRLRLICKLVGIESHVPADDETLWGAAFAVLGQIRAALEASQQAAEPVAWRTEFVVEAAKQSGFIRSEACCSDPLKFCEGDHWKGNIEGFAKAMVRLAAPAIQQPQDERVAMMEKP